MAFTEANLTTISLVIALVVMLGLLIRAEWRLNRLLRGKKGQDLEESIVSISSELKHTTNQLEEIERYLIDVEKRLRKGIRSANTIRYNPFTDHGGNQSFSTAFLNEDNDGVVISGLYSRDKVSVYAKPITKLKSEYELTKEERDALDGAARK